MNRAVNAERLREGHRDALTALGAVWSASDDAAAMASAVLRGADGEAFAAGMMRLAVEVLGEFCPDPAAWIARRQDEAALADG